MQFISFFGLFFTFPSYVCPNFVYDLKSNFDTNGILYENTQYYDDTWFNTSYII